MGAVFSRPSHRGPPGLPDTELTPCAILLYRLGVRVVALSFEHAVVTMAPLVAQSTRKGYFTVNPYVEQQRHELVQLLVNHVSNEACTFMVSLLAQGLGVVVTTEADDRYNGEVVKSSSSSSSVAAYQYDGAEVVRQVLTERLGPDLAASIHIATLDEVLHHKYPKEVLVVSPSSEIVKKARKRNMLALYVADSGP